jgi:hypothetical protein
MVIELRRLPKDLLRPELDETRHDTTKRAASMVIGRQAKLLLWLD